MDSSRFDQLTRKLATRLTRRTLMGTITASAASLAVNSSLSDRAVAQKCPVVGELCDDKSPCCGATNTTCTNGFCDCIDGAFSSDGVTCTFPSLCKGVYGVCTDEKCCPESGAVCSDGLCVCPQGSEYDGSSTCIPVISCAYLGEKCGNGATCCESTSTVCLDGQCVCPKSWESIDGYSCQPSKTCRGLNEPCDTSIPCCVESNSACINGLCSCPSGTSTGDGSTCLSERSCAEEGNSCVGDEECCSQHACIEGMCGTPRLLELCLPYGRDCSSDDQCCRDRGLICLGICTCPDGLLLDTSGTCVAACSELLGTCDSAQDCCAQVGGQPWEDLICRNDMCLCPTRTGLSEKKGRCIGDCAFPGEKCDEETPCCGNAHRCEDGICSCRSGEVSCGLGCQPQDVLTMPASACGAQNVDCGDDAICCGGACVPHERLKSDERHCGSCCQACRADEVCCDGVCSPGFLDIDPESGETRLICCRGEKVCEWFDGDAKGAVCCAQDETCLDGYCCSEGTRCGNTCCPPESVCRAGQCQTGLSQCQSEQNCAIGEECLNGTCCPTRSICATADGDSFCCGLDAYCVDPKLGICGSTNPTTRPIRPTRV